MKRQQHGFVLVLTLTVMVIVSIAAAYFSEQVGGMVESAQLARQNTQTLIDLASTRADITYRLATTTLTVNGLGRGNTVMALDNSAYQGAGGTMVRLQDTRGLLNLNQTPDDRLQRFLGLLGVPAEKRGNLVATLRDYTEPGKLERLNGAKAPQYLAQGLAPPSSNNLLTPWEARRIIGWRDTPELWLDNKFFDLTSTATVVGLNPNTAPPDVLMTLPGITNDMAQSLVQLRQQSPFMHVGQFAALAGIPEQLLDMQIFVLPGDTLRITQSAPGLNWGVQFSLTLTPNNEQHPWRIDYFSRVPIPTVGTQQALPPPLPLPPRSNAIPDANPMLRLD
jgi:DNA uptake protein ComE-like DNA-binding protein/type II secretory pathway pseudopilin PulG